MKIYKIIEFIDEWNFKLLWMIEYLKFNIEFMIIIWLFCIIKYILSYIDFEVIYVIIL